MAKGEDRFISMVAYQPAAPGAKIPRRGMDHYVDICSPEVIERAAWRFLALGGKSGLFHKSDGTDAKGEPPMRIVESSIHRGPPYDITAVNGEKVRITTGTWLIGAILRPDIWERYRKGEFGGASLDGTVQRVPATRKTLRQYDKKEN